MSNRIRGQLRRRRCLSGKDLSQRKNKGKREHKRKVVCSNNCKHDRRVNIFGVRVTVRVKVEVNVRVRVQDRVREWN